MSAVTFCFFGRLNDFMPRRQRERLFTTPFDGTATVKHLVEALGVPHPEIGAIQVGEHPVGLSYIPQAAESLSVYPAEPAGFGLGAPPHDPVEPWRFVLDNHLGKLAIYLRMLGYDVLYRNDYNDVDLAHDAHTGGRLLLTRDIRLLMRKEVDYGYWVRALQPGEQIREVVQRLALDGHARRFARCLRCNTPLEPVSKEEILDRLEPLTRRYFDEFHQCPHCGGIYWRGSHWEHMQKFLDGVLD